MASITQRLARIAPYLKNGRRALALAGLGAVVGASTEPMIPALLKPLLDQGFTARSLPLWSIPAALIALFFVRGLAGFVAQFGLASAAQNGVLQLRQAMFDRLLGADPGLYTTHSASQLTNTLVYEVQQGTTQLIAALLTLVKDSLTLVALLGYLLWLNWQLTIFVGLLFPTLAVVMRTMGVSWVTKLWMASLRGTGGGRSTSRISTDWMVVMSFVAGAGLRAPSSAAATGRWPARRSARSGSTAAAPATAGWPSWCARR